MNGVQAENLNSVAFNPFGQFIFHWDDPSTTYRKMVLTDNHGQKIQAGYVDKTAANWMSPDTWTDVGTLYSISNFRGNYILIYCI